MKPLILGLAAVLALSACQVQKAPDFDYTSFKESKPASILVVPPLNESPDVNGTWGVLASTAAPLSEAGYYVFPAAIANSLTDRGYQVSKTAAYNLLSPYSHNGILKGPRFVEEQPK